MEKRQIKIGLWLFILLIVLFVAAIGGCVYLLLNQNKNQENVAVAINEVKENIIVKQNIASEKKTEEKVNNTSKTNTTVTTKAEDKDIVTGTKLQKLLEPEDAWFCIKEGKKDGDNYIITVAMLDDEKRVITEREYEDILSGKEFEFRGLKWTKYEPNYNTDSVYIKSGEKQLSIMQNDDDTYSIENIAGVASNGLKDFSKNTFKFKVSKDISIYQFFAEIEYNENGDIMFLDIEGNEMTEKPDTTVDELLKMAKRNSGTYEECRAFVKNGEIEAIQILNK